MATTQVNQKVFVSPGVYTSETDLSFVAQSVGVTTLGLVGETLRGPAFEPIFITNYDEFQAFFGGTEPTKFVNTQIPKYEAAYIAKSYLQQSNQLFVTRILGLSGYDAGPSWSIKVKANVNGNTVDIDSNVATAPWSIDFTGDTTLNTFTITSGSLPAEVIANYYTQYRLLNGNVSTLSSDFNNILNNFAKDPTTTGTTAILYGSIPNPDYNNIITKYTVINNVLSTYEPSIKYNDLAAGDNDAWYYANFENTMGNDYSGYSFDYVVTSMFTASTTFTGTVTGNTYVFSGTAWDDVNNLVVATIRSRGISEYNSTQHGPLYEVSGRTDQFNTYIGDDLQMICSGSYQYVTSNPFATFLLSGYTIDNTNFSYEVSLDQSSSKFITKVLGEDNFGKNRLWVQLNS